MTFIKSIIVSCWILTVLFCSKEATGSCPQGSIDGFAFCCCKTIDTINPSASYSFTVMPSTVNVSASITITPSISVSSSPPIGITVSPSSAIPTPTPVYRGDSCFHTEPKYGYYNECYCNHTRYDYTGFNHSNGYYTNDENATEFDYKCWNLPRPKLYIGGLFHSDEQGLKIIEAANMAVEEINKNDAILPGYELVLLKKNKTDHWISTGSGVLLDYLNQNPKKVALLGPDDDDLAKTVAAIAGLPRYKLLQISYGTNAIELTSDHTQFYPYFFRTKPFLDLLYNAARLQMLRDYTWGKVGLLYSNDAYYRELNSNLRTQIQKTSGISIGIEEEFVTDPWTSMEHLKRKDVHVILGSFSGGDASRVLCAAYKLKMYGPRYVYLFIGYTFLSAVDGCTQDQVKCAARYQFFFNHNPIKCEHHFVANYTQRLNDTFFNTSMNPVATATQLDYAKYTYDAVNVIANVLHKVDPDKGNSSRFYLSYDYGSNDYGKKLKDAVLDYAECGASDNVSFGMDGNRYFKINVIQIRFGGGDLIVGDYDNKRSKKLNLPFVKWPGNNEPYREIRSNLDWRYISKGLYIAYCIFAGLGILFAIFCLVVLIWRRKHKEIRYSFYLMNIVIIIGCILVYISVFLYGVDNVISPVLTVDRICRARLWVFSIGFALVVGGLISKIWIAHDVLSRRLLMDKRKRKKIMFAILLAIFVITIIILLCWHFIDPLKRVIEYIRDEVNYPCDVDIWPDNPFTVKLVAVEQCKCTQELIWYFIICIWKAILLAIAVYWAYQTRDVFIPTINDTQRCGICAYVIAACTIIGFIIALTTRLLPDVFFGLVGLIIIGCVTAVLIILFLHKILLVFSCSRNRVMVMSATEEEDDKNCFSRCLSKCNCFGSMCGCCTRCCKGNCPKCFLCLAVCCAPFLACCAPLLACCSALFACCGSSCRNCCCGSKSQRNGTDKAGEQKFIVRGVGDDKSAELARLQRELEMKNKYIEQMRRTDFPQVRPIWTQTTEPVVLLSDTCDDDTDNDEEGNAGGGDGDGGKGRKKKKRRFRILNNKLDFSHIKSRTDSNYKNGRVSVVGKNPKSGNWKSPGSGNPPDGVDKNGGGIPLVYINSGNPTSNDEEVAKLKKLLAERDAELDRLKYGLGKKNELPEIDESVENEMKRGLGNVPGTKEQKPPTVLVINANDDTGNDKSKKKAPEDDDLDALLKEINTHETPRGGYEGSRNKSKIYGKKLDWSQIPSKLRAAGMISHDRPNDQPMDSDKSGPKKNKVNPTESNSSGNLSGPIKADSQPNGGYSGYPKRTANFKIFNERIDYSKIRSKIKPMLYNDMSRGSISSSENGSVRVLNGPAEYNKKQRGTPSASNVSLNKPEPPRNGKNPSPLDNPKGPSEINLSPNKEPKIESSPKQPDQDMPNEKKPDENIKTDPKFNNPNESKPIQDPPTAAPANSSPNSDNPDKPNSNVNILNDPKDYSHVKSKLVPDSQPATETKPMESQRDKPKSDVKILNDPKDYSQVKSKLIPDPPPKQTSPAPGNASPRDKPRSDVKILNDPKDYTHVKSKLIPDPPPKPSTQGISESPREKPKSDVKILNDPKNYSHVKSKLIPDPPAKSNTQEQGDTSPRDKPNSNVKILNDPKNYSHVKSKLAAAGPSHEPKKSTVKILNKPTDYSHVKSKLP